MTKLKKFKEGINKLDSKRKIKQTKSKQHIKLEPHKRDKKNIYKFLTEEE